MLPSRPGIKPEQPARKFMSLKENFVKQLNWNKNSYWPVVWEKLLPYIVKIWQMKYLGYIVKSWQKKKQLQHFEETAERCSFHLPNFLAFP